MEVNFVDVGLGSCQVILLGERRAIVIDCGLKSDHIALQFLRRNGITDLVRLITSHSDNDHTGGAVGILNDYQSAIDEIHVIQDHKWLRSRYWQRIDYLIRNEVLRPEQVKRLEIDDQPRRLWGDSEGSQLRLFSPTFVQNQQAQAAMSANSTSSVLVLDHRGNRVVFAADSEIPQWRQIYSKLKNPPLKCNVLAVPHHGGLIDATESDLDWLYSKAINANVAVLSVGTRRNPKHPRVEVVARLLTMGATVLCTQMTSRCHSNVHSIYPGPHLPLEPFGRTADDVVRKVGKCVACAGTVVATLSDSGTDISRLREHQAAVDSLSAHPKAHPLCRSSSAS